MFKITPPDHFITVPWKNGGGVTHEIARSHISEDWHWRISMAEVASDGPFSIFAGLSRILTVIDGNGIALHTPDAILDAGPLKPVHFSGDTPINSVMTDGPIRDLNVIFDANHVSADVVVVAGPKTIKAPSELTGLFHLKGVFTSQGIGCCNAALPSGAAMKSPCAPVP